MKTQKKQIHSYRRSLAGLVVFLAIAIWEAHLAQSAEDRRQRADFHDVNILRDLSIPVSQSEAFVSKLKAAGVDATLEIAKGRGHGVGGPNFAGEIANFFDKHLKTGSPD